MIYEIETAIKQRSFGKHMSALVGVDKPIARRNLASTAKQISPTVDTIFIQELTNLKESVIPRSRYLTSPLLFGVALSLILVFGMVYATLRLFALQSPSSFVEKGIDWGKVET
jgi:hypothetical protein